MEDRAAARTALTGEKGIAMSSTTRSGSIHRGHPPAPGAEVFWEQAGAAHRAVVADPERFLRELLDAGGARVSDVHVRWPHLGGVCLVLADPADRSSAAPHP